MAVAWRKRCSVCRPGSQADHKVAPVNPNLDKRMRGVDELAASPPPKSTLSGPATSSISIARDAQRSAAVVRRASRIGALADGGRVRGACVGPARLGADGGKHPRSMSLKVDMRGALKSADAPKPSLPPSLMRSEPPKANRALPGDQTAPARRSDEEPRLRESS